LTLFASSSKLEQAQADVKRYEGLIKESGREGVWVGKTEKDVFERAKQCALFLVERMKFELRIYSGQLIDTS
jgi:hypothetical protein